MRRFKAIERQALRKLDMLDAAPDLGTLATLPGNRLEALKGNRKGQHSIRVNDQWRICFIWREGHAFQNKMAMDLRVPVTRIADIVNERRGITADTALRFARYFKNTAAFWMNLQTRYDLEVAEDKLADKVERDVRPLEVVSGR